MSFPKAKIHRFNEEISCAPPPGKYDPKFDTKVKGVVIEKSKRFLEPKLSSASSIESIDSIGGKSTSSNNVLPVFRTPQLRKPTQFKTPKSVPHHSSANNLNNSTLVNARRNLDCESIVVNESTHLKTENFVLAQQLQQKTEELEKLHKEHEKLQNNMDEEQLKICDERNIAQQLHTEEIEKLKFEIEELEAIIEEDEKKHCAEIGELVTKSVSEIESLKIADEARIKVIEANFDKFQGEVETGLKNELGKLNDEVNEQISTLGLKLETTVTHVHEMDVEFDKKTVELNKLIDKTLTRLEEVLKDLTTVNAVKEELEKFNLEQKTALRKSSEKVSNFEVQLNKLSAELTKSQQKCKNFHVATMEHRKTIEALSKRLYESESEVERLNSVQSNLENQKSVLEGKADNLVMEVISLRESMKYLEIEIICDVEEIKNQLTAKVDSYRMKAAEETKTLLATVDEKQTTIDMLVREIDYYRNRLKESEMYVSNLKNKSEQCCLEIAQLKMNLTDAEKEFTERMNSQKMVYNILDDNYKEKCEMAMKLQQIQAEQEQHITDLVEKLDHQSDCARRATAQISCLTVENSEKENQIESLLSKLESSSECVKAITKHIENMVSQMDIKDNQIKMLQQEIELKSTSLKSTSDENDDLKYQLEQKMRHIEELEKEVRETHKDNEKYVDELISEIVLEKERASELSSLLSQTEEEKFKLEDGMKKIQLENEELAFKCLNLKEELQKMSDAVKSENEECLRVSKLLKEHEDNKKELEEKLEKENIEKAQLILELSTKIDNLEELMKSSDETKILTDEQNNVLKTQLEIAKEHIENLENINKSTERKAEELSTRVDQMSTKLKNQSEEMEKLQTDMDMINFEDAVASLKEEIIDLCDNIDNKERMVAELTEVKIHLENELKKITDEYKDKVKELETKVQQEIIRNTELNDSYNKMETRKNEYKVYSCKVTDDMNGLKEQLKKLQEEKTKLYNEKNQLEIMVGPFMKQLKDFEDEKNLLASKKDAVEGELFALERKYALALGHQNTKQRIHYVSRLKEENIQFTQTIDQLTSENLRLKNRCKDLELSTRENKSPRPVTTGKKSIHKEKALHSPNNALKDRNQV